MKVISHRVNSANGLREVPTENGVEIDVRSDLSGLYLSHDPFVSGETLASWLQAYRHSLLVLNVKEEGLEDECRKLLREHGITEYFFLDQSLPFLVKSGLSGHRDGACRISDFESIETVRLLSGVCDWVWIDAFEPSFERLSHLEEFAHLGMKTCLVSPELHGPARESEAKRLLEKVRLEGLRVDAVCTKYPLLWGAL